MLLEFTVGNFLSFKDKKTFSLEAGSISELKENVVKDRKYKVLRSAVVYGWVFVGHQVGASIAAIGAAVLRVKLGDYALAFYISAAMCLVAALAVLQIAEGKPTAELRG